jgi:hypothetical protein
MVVHCLEDTDETRSETRPTNITSKSQGIMGGLRLFHSRAVPHTHDWARSTYIQHGAFQQHPGQCRCVIQCMWIHGLLHSPFGGGMVTVIRRPEDLQLYDIYKSCPVSLQFHPINHFSLLL